MKRLLLMFLVSLCALAWRSPDLLAALGLAATARSSQASEVSVADLTKDGTGQAQPVMSIDEFARLSKTDPDAARKFLASHTVQERGAADKLMNLFAHGKYE